MKQVLILVFLLLQLNIHAQNNIFNILDFGAKGDSTTINTKAIQKAVDACNKAGGGKVFIPPGKFISGTIVLKDNVELHLEQGSTLFASIRHEDFPIQPLPAYRSHKDQLGGFFAMIYAEGAENIAITGHGTIDGRGKLQEPRPNPKAGDIDGRPRNIMLISCNKVHIEGIEMRNSGVWNQHYLNCEDVFINNINVYNHSNRNNDGIDIDGCRRVVLSNSILDSDDDCITLKSTGAAPCKDIVITNCVVSSFCNAIKAGTESSGGFQNISISNCIIKPSRSTETPVFNTPESGITGLSFIIVDGGTMKGISVSNITIYGTMSPLYIRLGNRARKFTDGIPTPGVGKVENISISNVVAYGAGTWGVSITGIPGYPVKNITLDHIQIFTKGGIQNREYSKVVKEDIKGYPQPSVWGNLPAYGFYLRHVKNVSLSNIMLGVETADVRVPVMVDDVEGLRITNVSLITPVSSKPFVVAKSIINYKIEKPLGWEGEDKELVKIQ